MICSHRANSLGATALIDLSCPTFPYSRSFGICTRFCSAWFCLGMLKGYMRDEYNQFTDTSSLSRSKYQHLNISRLFLQLFLSNPLKPGRERRRGWSSYIHPYTPEIPHWHRSNHIISPVPVKYMYMMRSSNWSIFRVSGGGKSTSHWWIPLTKASEEELWCFI